MGSRVPGKIEARYNTAPNSKTRVFHVDRKWDVYSRLVILAGIWQTRPSSVEDTAETSSGTTVAGLEDGGSRGLRSSPIGVSESSSGAMFDLLEVCVRM